jgi:cobalt-zinc-cadmium efflux system membrane fusion protein
MKQYSTVLIICILAIACKGKQPAETEGSKTKSNQITLTDAQFKNAGIVLTTLQPKSISSIIKTNGRVDVPPQNLVSVSVALGGYLKSTKLLPGMHVSKGEVIAVMEDQQYIQLQQDYLLAKSKLHFAELEYNRQKELNQSQASSDKVTQQAQAEVSIQKITMNALAEKLRLIGLTPDNTSANNISKTISVLSKIDGYVSKVNVNIGKYVTPADVLFELINPTDIHLNMQVFEKEVPKLVIGQKVMAYTNAQPNKKYECEIILISKDIASNGTTDVHCHFDAQDKSLLPGTYMNAEVSIKAIANNALPEVCVVHYEGKDFVFVETGKQQYALVEVIIQAKESGFLAIENAKALEGKKIVSNGSYMLLMQMKNNKEEK